MFLPDPGLPEGILSPVTMISNSRQAVKLFYGKFKLLSGNRMVTAVCLSCVTIMSLLNS